VELRRLVLLAPSMREQRSLVVVSCAGDVENGDRVEALSMLYFAARRR
jgi:hypothetical protein